MNGLTWVGVSGGRLALFHRPKKTAFADLRAEGCTAILTLLSAREGAETIGAAASQAGLEWIWLPLDNGEPPGDGRDADVRRAFDTARLHLENAGAVLIHCSAGIHRTGMIGYALLRYLGLDPDMARARLRALRSTTADGVGESRLAWGDRLRAVSRGTGVG